MKKHKTVKRKITSKSKLKKPKMFKRLSKKLKIAKSFKKKIKIHKTPKIVNEEQIVPIVNAAKKIRKPRKITSVNSPLMYFTDDTQQAIINYNATDDQELKNKIYVEHIHFPFSKLVENIFNTFKFSYFETSQFDVQKECLSHLVANIHKFDPTRKSKKYPLRKAKAFAYFSIVAKHFLILLNNNNYKKFNQNVEIGEDHEEHTVQLQQVDKHHAQQEMNDFMRLMVEYFEKNANKIFPKKKDVNIANAIVELLRNSNRIDIFNKKTLYLYIREISDCKTQNITKILTKMKQHYHNISNCYKNTGLVDI